MSLTVDESAVKRLQELRAQKDTQDLWLRVTVDSGGCSGFQYILDLTSDRKDDDLLFGDTVITDDVSMLYLGGSSIGFAKALAGSEFTIDNPNAVQGCGCGKSFSE